MIAGMICVAMAAVLVMMPFECVRHLCNVYLRTFYIA